jgi:hypothetical protein
MLFGITKNICLRRLCKLAGLGQTVLLIYSYYSETATKRRNCWAFRFLSFYEPLFNVTIYTGLMANASTRTNTYTQLQTPFTCAQNTLGTLLYWYLPMGPDM